MVDAGVALVFGDDLLRQSGNKADDLVPQSGNKADDLVPQSGNKADDLVPQSGNKAYDLVPQSGYMATTYCLSQLCLRLTSGNKAMPKTVRTAVAESTETVDGAFWFSALAYA